MHFPATRLRRLRQNAPLRDLIQETHLLPAHLIAPLFILEGDASKQAIDAMPGIYRRNIQETVEYAHTLMQYGVRMVVVFPIIDPAKKTDDGVAAWADDALAPRAIETLKSALPDLIVMSDVALDPYTTHGQDGILINGYVDNDKTLVALVRQALAHAQAGADIIAPSDMMDGRIQAIRNALEAKRFVKTGILSYAAKYASCLYGPFRDAVGSKDALKGDKSQYQMHPANSAEALREVALDIDEGADMVMVKPAGMYLDVIRRIKDSYNIPLLGYQVSGEYAMLKSAIASGYLGEEAILESLIAIRRAGCDGIITYFALDIARHLTKGNLS